MNSFYGILQTISIYQLTKLVHFDSQVQSTLIITLIDPMEIRPLIRISLIFLKNLRKINRCIQFVQYHQNNHFELFIDNNQDQLYLFMHICSLLTVKEDFLAPASASLVVNFPKGKQENLQGNLTSAQLEIEAQFERVNGENRARSLTTTRNLEKQY